MLPGVVTYAHEFLDLALLHALLQGALLGCGKPVWFTGGQLLVPFLVPALVASQFE